MDDLSKRAELEDSFIHSNVNTYGLFSNQKLEPLTANPSDNAKEAFDQSYLLIGETIETYNESQNKSLELSDNEVAITSNLLELDELSTIDIDGKEYKTKQVADDVIPSAYGVEVIYLAFPHSDELEAFRNTFLTYDGSQNDYVVPVYNSTYTLM